MKQFPLVSRLTSLKNAARLVKNPIPVVQETMANLGDSYFFHMGGRTKGLLTRELGLIQHVLQKNHKNYHKSPLQSKELAAYIGKGLLTNNGAPWLRQRRLIQPAFSRKNINQLAELMRKETEVVLDREVGDGGLINCTHLGEMLTFGIIARAMFSDEVTHADMMQMRDNIQRVQKMIILQVRQPYKRWYYSLTGMIRHHKGLVLEAKHLVEKVVVNRQQSGHRRGDLLDYMMDLRYEDTGEPMALAQLVDELLILMVAGHETTAQSFAWTLFLLNNHRGALTKTLDAIRQPAVEPMAYFSPDNYLMAMIKESMRLYPPAWVIDRIGLEDDEWNGYPIPKNTIIMNFTYGLHYDERYWSSPKEFRPERFIEQPKREAYFPFGAGPRLCIGNHFTLLELAIAFDGFLSRYEIGLEPVPQPTLNPLITLQPAKPIYLQCRLRS